MKIPTLFFTLIILLATILIFFSQQKPYAPNLTLTSIKNQKLSINALRNKVVLVNFWATSCSGCIKEIPKLIKLHQQFTQRGFEIIAVAMQYDPPNFVVNFTQENALPFFVTLDSNGEIAQAFDQVTLTPTSFLLNKRGQIIQKWIGEPDIKQLHELITEQLTQ